MFSVFFLFVVRISFFSFVSLQTLLLVAGLVPGKICRDPGSNRGPLDLQSNALPTELSRRVHRWSDRTFVFVSSLALDFNSSTLRTYVALRVLMMLLN
jgi:hypothetical protein